MLRRHHGRRIIAACLLLALTLVVLDARGSLLGGRLRGVVGSVAGPIQQVVAIGVGPIRSAVGSGEQVDVAALAAENERLREALGQAARKELAQKQAQEYAALGIPAGYDRVPADVVAVSGPMELARAVTIDRGSTSGVAVGAAVIAGPGLVGVVDSVAATTATVRLVTDQATAVGARVADGAEVGMYRGSGRAEQGTLELLDPLGDMAAGDLVVTLGSPTGAPFPKGLPIGRVTAVTGSATSMDRRGVVQVAVDTTALESVLVLVSPGELAAVAGVRG